MASLWRRHQQRALSKMKNTLSTWAAFAILSMGAVILVVNQISAMQSQLQVSSGPCDFSQGSWVRDPSREAPYGEGCSDIFKGWNCIRNGRDNAGASLRWRWQPRHCQMPRLDPFEFLQKFRGKNIAFIGDSLNRNMFASLVCSLKKAAGTEYRKWRPIGSDKGITFLAYNVTVAYHRTNLLARYTRWTSSADGGDLGNLGFKEGFRVDVDVPQSSWIQAPQFYHVLVLSTGHWWLAPDKFNPESSPMLFFEGGKPILPPKSPEEGLQLTLQHMMEFVDRNMAEGGLKFLRTQSPRHFEGGDWKEGGVCHRSEPLSQAEVARMFNVTGKSVNSEVHTVNKYLALAASKSRSFHLLNVTSMSEFRADGHPSTSAKKVHEDCMHWCLPGIVDFWNDMLVADILKRIG